MVSYNDGTRKRERLHRLIAKAFIPNPNNCEFVNHKDGNKANNCIDNLEWCNTSQNTKHAYDTGLIDIINLNLLTVLKQRLIYLPYHLESNFFLVHKKKLLNI